MIGKKESPSELHQDEALSGGDILGTENMGLRLLLPSGALRLESLTEL